MTPRQTDAQTDAHDRLARVQQARSFLFVPGDRPDRFDKAAGAGADLVIVDLEDAVAEERRPAAREQVAGWLAGGGAAAVRVSAVGTPDHAADVEALASVVAPGDEGGLLGVVVAKAEDPVALSGLALRLRVPLLALVETARGVARAADIAGAEGVARLAFGHLDLAADLGAEPTREAMLHSRSALVLASRAAGLPGPVDGVTTALDDAGRLAEDLAHARGLGMTGKLLIHPRQVDPTHAAYRPTEDQLAWAERVLAAVAEGGTGAVRVDGDMVDPPVVARAEDILRRKDR